jgi:ATP/maltotriose-dependent transcriptional regulator MalT
VSAPAMKLLEREQAEGRLASLLEGAATGRGGVLFLVGDPGLGKTTLLAECCHMAKTSASGFAVQRAGCSELEQAVPFGLLDRLIAAPGAQAEAAGPLTPGGAPTASPPEGSGEARLLRYSATVAWLRHEAPRPLLLAVDDLHWADEDSVELLSLLCRRLEQLPVALVATARPWPSGAVEQARLLAHDGHAEVQRLQPLSEPASAELLERAAESSLPGAFVEQAAAACAGNPLLLREVASAWKRGDDVLSGAPSTLGQHLFLPRFAGVGANGLRWARAASVLGTRFRLDLVPRLSGQGPDDTAQAVEALCATGLLRVHPSGAAELVHPLFRQALYDDLSVPTRRGLHAGALNALLEDGAPPAEAAPHAVGAAHKGDPTAIAVLAAAGRQALASGAVKTAVEHLRAAVELSGPTAEPGLQLELAASCLLTGELELASTTVRDVLSRQELSGADRVAATRLEARVLMASARYAEAARLFAAASDLAAATSGPELAAEVLLDSAFIGHLFEGASRARKTAQQAVRLAELSGNRSLAEATHQALGYLDCVGGDPSHLDDMARAARADMAEVRRRSAWSWDNVFGYAHIAKISERFDECERMFGALMEQALRQGSRVTYQTLAINHSDTLWRLGRLDEACALLGPAAEAAELVPTLAPFAWVGLAHLNHELGDRDESARWAGRLEGAMNNLGQPPYLRLWLCMISCREELRAGKVENALRLAELAEETAESSGVLEPCLVPWHSAALDAAIAAGRLERAERFAQSLERLCQPLPCQAPRAVAAWGAATVAWHRGDIAAAETGFIRAVELSCTVPMPLSQAEALLAYGRFLRKSGQVSAARKVLHRALATLEPTGAGRLQAIAETELASTGGRRRRSGPTSELTAREKAVAHLAAEGLTNPEIGRALYLSAKTVDHHLSRTYAKLGISSRRELMLAWRQIVAAAPEP